MQHHRPLSRRPSHPETEDYEFKFNVQLGGDTEIISLSLLDTQTIENDRLLFQTYISYPALNYHYHRGAIIMQFYGEILRDMKWQPSRNFLHFFLDIFRDFDKTKQGIGNSTGCHQVVLNPRQILVWWTNANRNAARTHGTVHEFEKEPICVRLPKHIDPTNFFDNPIPLPESNNYFFFNLRLFRFVGSTRTLTEIAPDIHLFPYIYKFASNGISAKHLIDEELQSPFLLCYQVHAQGRRFMINPATNMVTEKSDLDLRLFFKRHGVVALGGGAYVNVDWETYGWKSIIRLSLINIENGVPVKADSLIRIKLRWDRRASHLDSSGNMWIVAGNNVSEVLHLPSAWDDAHRVLQTRTRKKYRRYITDDELVPGVISLGQLRTPRTPWPHDLERARARLAFCVQEAIPTLSPPICRLIIALTPIALEEDVTTEHLRVLGASSQS